MLRGKKMEVARFHFVVVRKQREWKKKGPGNPHEIVHVLRIV